MNRIDTLQIHNFKFFQNQDPIKLGGNHMLLYGENGSGKSSVYWSLYTLFEASLKPDETQIRKYFSKTVFNGDDCLVNIHATETELGTDDYNSFIEVITDDAQPVTYRISTSEVTIRTNENAKQINYASDFINYRLLLGFSSFPHSKPIDLFEIFIWNIFYYVRFAAVEVTRNGDKITKTSASEIWNEIEQGPDEFDKGYNYTEEELAEYIASDPYKDFVKTFETFHERLQSLIDYINLYGSEYLEKLGYSNFKYQLNLENATFVLAKNEYKVNPFKAGITITEYDGIPNPVKKPHSFLNEARFSAMAISIRLAILKRKLQENCLKFIVLDDLLISLDMRNREKVLDLFLAPEFSNNYQLLILTHDRSFYQMAKHKIDLLEQDNWVYYEMYETKIGGISKPLIKGHKTYLEKAQTFFDENNLEESANNLRKAAEAFCKKVLAKTDTITEDYSDLDLNGMLNKCNNFAVMNGLDKAVFDELDKHRKFILNASSHDDIGTAKFKNELEECLNLFHRYFSKVKTKNILTADTQLHFDLVDGKDGAVYLFEVTLDDNFKLYKEPGKPSVLIKGRITYTIKKDGTLITTPPVSDFRSIQKLYDDPYKSSDKAKNADFWEEIIIAASGHPLKSARAF
ncbi:MAG: AAA family ATPase [Lacibacter sp.]